MKAQDRLTIALWEADRHAAALSDRLAHEYPDQPELRLAALRAAIGAAGEIGAAFER